MRLSTKGCYGLRAMVELAKSYGDGPLLMQAIANSQRISRKYLHALLTTLRAAGLVRSVRGAGGGYLLARPPGQIQLNEVLQTLEGAITFTDCVRDKGACERSLKCVGHDLWCEMSRVVDELLAGITLADLVVRQAELERRTEMYYI
jgi:Rrf2 family protein